MTTYSQIEKSEEVPAIERIGSVDAIHLNGVIGAAVMSARVDKGGVLGIGEESRVETRHESVAIGTHCNRRIRTELIGDLPGIIARLQGEERSREEWCDMLRKETGPLVRSSSIGSARNMESRVHLVRKRRMGRGGERSRKPSRKRKEEEVVRQRRRSPWQRCTDSCGSG